MSAPLVLFDDDPVQNDRLIGIPDAQARLKERLLSHRPTVDAPLLVRLHIQNFWKLPKVIRLAADWLNVPVPEREPLSVDDPEGLPDRLLDHLEHLKADLRGSPITLDCSDHVPATVLKDLAARARARPEERTHLLRLLGILADAVFIGPLTFHADLSNVCNTDCIFCGLHSPLLRPGEEINRGRRLVPGWERSRLDPGLFDALIRDLAATGSTEDLLFTGEGEPLTHPGLSRMVIEAKDLGAHLTVFTNGLLLDEAAARLFVERGVDLVYWSLSAGTKGTFHLVQPSQPVGSFDRAVRNIKHMIESRRSLGTDRPRVVLAHVLVRQNVRDCLAVMDLARDLGVEIVRYQLAHSCGPGFDDLLLGSDGLKMAQEQIYRAREMASDLGITVLSNIDLQLDAVLGDSEGDHPSDRWGRTLVREAGCLAGWFFSRTFTDGMVSFCCHDKIVGDLNATSFKDLWFSDHLRRIRRAARLFDPDRDNPELSVGRAGGRLIGPDCATCGNYEVIARAMADLKELGLWPIIERERSDYENFMRIAESG